MKIKRFVAPDMRTAFAMVRQEHGPDAVILSNRVTEDGVEIVAASNYDEALVQRTLEAMRPAAPAAPLHPLLDPATPAAAANAPAQSPAQAAASYFARRQPATPAAPHAEVAKPAPAAAEGETEVETRQVSVGLEQEARAVGESDLLKVERGDGGRGRAGR